MSTPVFHVKTSKDVMDAIQNSKTTGLPLLLKFEASWCGPCKKIAPTIQQLATFHRNIFFMAIDVDECPDVAADFNITSMPTFLGIKNGKIISEILGADIGRIRQVIDQLST